MNIFIVIPFYNEEIYIKDVIKSVSKFRFPIIVIDDGSVDKSAKIVKNIKARNLTILNHNKNLGKGMAIKTGADYAFSHNADAVIFMDSDGQHLAQDIDKFVEVLKLRKYDIVFGTRIFGYSVPLVRYLGNKFASVFVNILFGIYVSDLICGFRAITKKAYKKLRWESTGYGIETEMVIMTKKFKLKYCEVPVQSVYHDRSKGVNLIDAVEIFWEVIKWKLK